MIGTDGEKGSGKSVMSTQLDDNVKVQLTTTNI